MEKKNHLTWLRELYVKFGEVHAKMSEECLQCARFASTSEFDRSHLKNSFWGVCPEHIDHIVGMDDDIIELYLKFEREVGINESSESLFRHTPDGRLCSLRSPVWHEHLCSLVAGE